LNLAPQIVVRDTATLSYDYENGMTEGWKFPQQDSRPVYNFDKLEIHFCSLVSCFLEACKL